MSQHTPGPWETGTDEDAHMIYDGTLGVVADSLRDDGDVEAERANARLIAAAPDLLAACRGMAKEARDILANDDPTSEEGRAARALLDAIAKAEGRT